MTIIEEGSRYEIHGPPAARVELVDYNVHGAETLAKATRGYTHKFSNDITEEEVKYFLDNVTRTRLNTTVEMIYFSFLIHDVTRAFTHQMVRYRIGTVFAQESLRFAVRNKVRVLATAKLMANTPAMIRYEEAVQDCAECYYSGMEAGVPTEDMRGILPTNVLTAMFFSASLKTLANIYEQRMCCQTQPGEWQEVCKQIKRLVRGVDPRLSVFLRPPAMGAKCGFQADFDKPCIYVGKTAEQVEEMSR